MFDVCLSLTSLSLPINKVVSIIRSWKESRNKKLEVRYCLYRDKNIPEFYSLKEEVIELGESIIDRRFWDYLLQLIQEEKMMLKKGVRKIVLDLKRAEKNVSWCNEVLGHLQEINTDGFDEQQFLEELNSAEDLTLNT